MIYLFYNTKTEEYREIEMSMKEYAPYRGENNNEEEWERVYDVPQISMGNSTSKTSNPYSQNEFVERGDVYRFNVNLCLEVFA